MKKKHASELVAFQKGTQAKLKIVAHISHEYSGHLLRDSIFKLYNLAKDGRYSNKILMDYVYMFCDKLAAYAENIFTSIYEQTCVVNVRLLDYSVWVNSVIPQEARGDVYIHSFGRSGDEDASRRRADIKTYQIKDDVGYMNIFVEEKSDFVKIDIFQTDPSGPYMLKIGDDGFYNNVLIVPIRIKVGTIDHSRIKDNKNNLFGFVSVDFKDSSRVGEIEIAFGLDFIKIFADSAYLYIEEIRKIMLSEATV